MSIIKKKFQATCYGMLGEICGFIDDAVSRIVGDTNIKHTYLLRSIKYLGVACVIRHEIVNHYEEIVNHHKEEE